MILYHLFDIFYVMQFLLLIACMRCGRLKILRMVKMRRSINKAIEILKKLTAHNIFE